MLPSVLAFVAAVVEPPRPDRSERIEGTAYQIARGSNCRHDWTLNLPLPAGTAAAASCSTLDAAGQPLDCAIGVADGRLLVSVADGSLLALDDEARAWRTVARTSPRIVHRMVPAEAGVILVGGAAGKDNLDRVEWVALP
jgi:hypothetical protein